MFLNRLEAFIYVFLMLLLLACTGHSGGDDDGDADAPASADGGFQSQTGFPDWIKESMRDLDPVLLTGENLDLLAGRDPATLVAFRYADAWAQVPVQVDERAEVGVNQIYNDTQSSEQKVWVYTDVGTFAGSDFDPKIDADDEVVFMTGDMGKRPENFAEPAGVEAGSGVEVRVADPDDEGQVAYIYLFSHDGSLKSSAGKWYGVYTFSLEAGEYPYDFDMGWGPNPEDSWFKSYYYKRHFSDRWVSDAIQIIAGDASGVDILDIHNNQLDLETCSPNVATFSETEGAFVTNKRGPLRSIRSYMGAQSGTYTQRTHLFYKQREDIITDLRVHGIDGIMEYFDYSEAAVGMTYYNHDNPEGVTVDGEPDEIESDEFVVVEMADDSWELMTGEQGSLVIVHQADTDIGDAAGRTFYLDQAPAEMAPCLGDDSYYGASGRHITSEIPCTDLHAECSNYYQATRTLYFLEPEISKEQAQHLAENLYRPLKSEVAETGQ